MACDGYAIDTMPAWLLIGEGLYRPSRACSGACCATLTAVQSRT
ncbi:hypothetical protein ASAP_2877 [Asaia bogorensis]|uniref:Uncharacterized protein n=1 Tax=Asaia bogorensis TaxID=91915 RepID=A0A060QM52_9PROT|nr:hypothetical protein ASAP_2877 [Asaia bogorensis]